MVNRPHRSDRESAARRVRDALSQLLDLSRLQLEQLDQNRWPALEATVKEKDRLLENLAPLLDELQARGWVLKDPATFPAAGEDARHLREARALAQALDAHEKYVRRHMQMLMEDTAARLHRMNRHRRSTRHYIVSESAGRTLDQVK